MVALLSEFKVLIVPGLHNSGAEHWQTRWQRLYPRFQRVEQDDWDTPDLASWADRLDAMLHQDRRPTLLVAHSFGCLTAVRSIANRSGNVAGALLVAPADPDKFGVAAQLPSGALDCPSILISSSNDPWLSAPRAAELGRRWGSKIVRGGKLGHINAESQLGDWPIGQSELQALAELAHNAWTLAPSATGKSRPRANSGRPRFYPHSLGDYDDTTLGRYRTRL